MKRLNGCTEAAGEDNMRGKATESLVLRLLLNLSPRSAAAFALKWLFKKRRLRLSGEMDP